MIREDAPRVKDPVCGMEMDLRKVQYTTELFGKTYYFCSEMDRDKFLDDPEKYVGSELVRRGPE